MTIKKFLRFGPNCIYINSVEFLKTFPSPSYNYLTACVPVNSRLNLEAWRHYLQGYWDSDVVAFLEYGWPINFSSAKLTKSTFKNHSSALKRPDIIDDYIKTEMQNAAIIGPFESNPFSLDCVVSPLQVVIKDSTSKPSIVHDLSFPERFSVDDGISNDTFLNDSFELRLDRLIEFIREKGFCCHIFKTDLRRAFRQIPVDPADIPLLGFQVNDLLYFHVVLPFRLRSAVLICQRTTKAVVFILTKDNALVDVYIDDFFGAATVEEAPFVYNRLLFLLRELGLEISPEKCLSLQPIWCA